MRWSKPTLQPFLDVRTAALNDTLEDAFRRRHHGFRPVNDNHGLTAAACSLSTILHALIEIRRAGDPILMVVSARAVAQFYPTNSDSLLFYRSVIDILRTTPHIHIGAAT